MAVQWIVTRASVGAERVVFGITTFPPNGRHDIHRHPHAEEVEYLVEGEGLARVGDVDVQMRPGDVVFVKTGEAHGFWNTSETERAVLVWCYGGAASLDEAGYVYEPDAAHGLPVQGSPGAGDRADGSNAQDTNAQGTNAQGTNAQGTNAQGTNAAGATAHASGAAGGTIAPDAGRDGARQPDGDHAG